MKQRHIPLLTSLAYFKIGIHLYFLDIDAEALWPRKTKPKQNPNKRGFIISSGNVRHTDTVLHVLFVELDIVNDWLGKLG